MVFKSWVFWCFLRLRLTPVTMQRLNPRGSIGNHVLKSIIYKSLGFLFNWWSSLKGSANWIFNSYKAPRGTMTMMVLHSQSPTVKRHPNGPLVPGRFLSDRKVTCIARFRAPLLHIFQHGSGLRRNTKIRNWFKSTLFFIVLSPYSIMIKSYLFID